MVTKATSTLIRIYLTTGFLFQKKFISDKCYYFQLWFVHNVTLKLSFRIKLYINRLSKTKGVYVKPEMTYTL